jgi:ASC-1-like (ASCH) protein
MWEGDGTISFSRKTLLIKTAKPREYKTFSCLMLRPELILCVVSAVRITTQHNRTLYLASSKKK